MHSTKNGAANNMLRVSTNYYFHMQSDKTISNQVEYLCNRHEFVLYLAASYNVRVISTG